MSLQYPDHKIILASGSPRRKKFFEDMGFTVDIQVREVDEVFPTKLVAQQIPAYPKKVWEILCSLLQTPLFGIKKRPLENQKTIKKPQPC
jgi:hypothetical protein